jgi:serine/threonine-protein kinase HipA
MMAPLYDLGSHAPYPTRNNAPVMLAMSIEGKYRMSAVGLEALERTGMRLGLDRDYSRQRGEAITQGIVQAYQKAADDARTQLGDDPFIEEMVGAIEAYASDRGWHRKSSVV